MKNNKRVVLDIDGVCLDFDKGFSIVGGHVLNNGKALETIDIHSYDLKQRYGINKDDEMKIWDALPSHENGWSGLPELERSSEVVKSLKKNGYTIHVVTGIPEEFADLRILNLKKYGIEIDEIFCVGHGKASKLQHMKDINPILYVDDRLQHINECDFIPNRIWVNLEQDQHGFEKDLKTVEVLSLKNWFDNAGQKFLRDNKFKQTLKKPF